MSPISASDLVTTLLSDVMYPLGSTEVAEPEEVVVPDIYQETNESSNGGESKRRMRT